MSTATEYAFVHLNDGGGMVHIRRVMRCPNCEKRRRFVEYRPVSPYYDSNLTCTTCGDSFSHGERLPRPFVRGWRDGAARRAREHWANAEPASLAMHRWLRLAREYLES